MHKSVPLALAGALLTTGVAGLAGPASAGGHDAAAAATYRVTLKVSEKDAVAKETTLVLTGKVRPKPARGAKVALQLQYDNKLAWKTLGTVGVKRDGSYRFKDKPKSSLERSYRVVKATDAKAGKGISRERAVDVQQWTWLTYRETSATSNVLSSADDFPINGEDYDNTLYLDQTTPSGYREWTLGRKCSSLEATFGLSDRTATGGQGSVTATIDGVVAFARVFNLGESDSETIDVSDVYRLRMDFARNLATPPTEPAAGAARVLCD